MGYKARPMGPVFYIIEGLQICNTLFIKNITLANEMRPVSCYRATEHGVTEQTENCKVGLCHDY